jgi:molecular chaperone HscB
LDYFSFLSLPRKLNLDVADLEQRYRALSRQFHPDFYYNAPPAERRASLENTSYLNDAYRTLKNPVARIEYLLKVEGVLTPTVERDGFSRAGAPPPGLLEEVFALNEELDEIRQARSNGTSAEALKARLEHARKPVEDKRDAHERDLKDLAARWDATGDRRTLEALRERILERNYINNLLAGIERELNL